MQALSQFLGLESLKSIIDCSPLMVVPETPLSDAIALMATQSKSVLVGSCSKLVGCFTKHDIVQLIASGTDLKTAKISEVMHTSVKTLKVSEFPEITCALSLLCQQELDLLPVVDKQGQVVGVITPESICQGLASEIEKTRDNYEQTPEKCSNFGGCTRCCLDIIEQKQAFEVLQENATQLTFALETTNTIYWEQNLNQERMLFLSLLGEPREIQEMSYSKFPDLIHPNDRKKFASNYSWAIASTGYFEIEHRIFLQGRSPGYKCFLTRGILRENTTGKHACLIGVSVDITSHVQAKEEQLALEKSEEWFRFLAESISQEVWNAQENNSTISDISEQQVVLQEGKLAEEALKHSEERFCNLVEASSVIYFTSQYESVPCCMDEKLLGHILNNLLSNAIKYSPDDSIVKFSLGCQNGQAIFQIQDWGIGIPEEDIPYLFESFHRASNVGNILGNGLGMSIVKKCVDIHQREIFVTSPVGLGTNFTVIISLNNKI